MNHAAAPNGAFQMPMFKEWVPARIQPWIYVLLAIGFQLTGGVYLGALNEMVGGRSWMREDLTMCVYANLLGMAMYFPLLFRMKFRFTNKTLLMLSACTILVCNALAVGVESLPLLWFICFVEGMAKIQGTFECMSNIQLWITPKRDFRVFFPVLHIIILCSMQLSDLMTTYLCYYYHWTFMHWLIAGMMLGVLLTVWGLTKHFHLMRPLPLYGIDWGGALLWSVLFFEVAYLFNYGDWLDYFHSRTFCTVALIAGITLVGCLHRMFRIRHPYFEPTMWSYKHLVPILLLITLVEFLLASEHTLEEIFLEEGLKYEAMVASQLDWLMLVGVLLGCGFALLWLKVLRLNYYRLLAIGFAGIAAYLIGYYFLISPDINFEMLMAPTVARGFAYAILSATFMLCLEEVMTFQHFFQALSVFNVLHMLMGGVIGSAAFTKAFAYCMADNMDRYGAWLTPETTTRLQLDWTRFMPDFVERMELISIKQVYGYAAFAALFFCLALAVWDIPSVRSTLKKMPSWRGVGRQLKRSWRTSRSQ